MKNMLVIGCALSCITMLMLACTENKGDSTAGAIDNEQIKKEIQAKEDSFANVYNSGELKNIGYYADDAKSFLPNRPPLVGRDSIIAFLKADLASAANNKIKYTTNEVFVSDGGNRVLELGSFLVADSANNPINTGNYMSLFEKRNGRYVALRDMSVSDSVR
jgi:ketosteroid isomerase-like protein